MSSKEERFNYNNRHYTEMAVKLNQMERINNGVLSENELYHMLKSISSDLFTSIEQKKVISDPLIKKQIGRTIGKLEQQRKAVVDYMKLNNI